MNVLSLFDGMSCGQIALTELGFDIETYYASEIDKHAIKQTQLNFPNTIQLGSVVDVDVRKLKPIDLLIGGSPCQSFSFAGKRKGMATKCEIEITKLSQYLELKEQGFEFEGQSYLFWEYMRILTDIRKYNPNVKFLLENVEMGSKWERILSEAIGIFGVHINSALVSAQNRERIYWTNIRTKSVGLFGELHSDIPQPKDRGILLKDILESEVDEKYYLRDAAINRALKKDYSQPQINPDKTGTLNTKNNSGQCSFDSGTTFITPDKSFCIDANYFKGISFEQYLLKHRRQLVTDSCCVAMRGRNPDNSSDRKPGAPTEQRLELKLNGKTNCLTSVQKDNLVMQYTENYLQLKGNGFDSDNRFFYDDGKHGSVLTRGEDKTGVVIGTRIRRLTPTECARLQTIPEWYKWECSDTQQYKMLGNGWTVEVIKHIFSFLNI